MKQTIGGEGIRGVVRFLAPDILVGLFLAISSSGMNAGSFPLRVAIVCSGVALFTLLAETRKFFFSGGDLEGFYFVQPTAMSRVASGSGLFLLNMAVSASIFLPVGVISPPGGFQAGEMAIWYLISVLVSLTAYLVILFVIAILPGKAANRTLTLLQIVMALGLLAAFQLSARLDVPSSGIAFLPEAAILFASAFVVFAALPVSERLISKLNENEPGSVTDLVPVAERLKMLTLARDDEEQAGFVFYLANLFRSSPFRLSTIGVAGTPVMVAIYWSVQNSRFITFNVFSGFVTANLVAPLTSLMVSGIIVYYFLTQNIMSSRDFEAKWQLESSGGFNYGRFVLGVRKGLLLTVHLPITILLFAVSIFTNPFLSSLITAVTFYSVGHVAISWFSIMQRRLPFSAPFTQLGAMETVNLLFMFGFSFLTTTVLFVTFGSLRSLLMVNLFALILVGVLEYFSTLIVNKRVKVGI